MGTAASPMAPQTHSAQPKPPVSAAGVVLAQLEVAKAAVPSTLELPYTSDKLSLAKEFTTDQWGKPFCVTGDKAAIVILSTGGANLNLKCRAKVNTEKMKNLPRMKTIKTETGYYALVVDRK